MKIIKEGNIPPADRPWWTKQIIVCGYCVAQYQLDESDNPAHGGGRHPEWEHWVQSFCPTCKKSVTSKRVVMRGASPENDGAAAGAVVFAVSNDGGETGVAWREDVHEALAYLDLQNAGGKTDYCVVAIRKSQHIPTQ